MIRLMKMMIACVCLLAVSHVSFAAEKIFDPTRDSAKDLSAAEDQAQAQHKNILLDVGGNWCPWCVVLERTIHGDKKLSAAMDASFVVVHVNFSKENMNQAFLSQYPKVSGYPYLFVLSPSGKLLQAQSTSPLESDHKLDDGYNYHALLDFAHKWQAQGQ